MGRCAFIMIIIASSLSYCNGQEIQDYLKFADTLYVVKTYNYPKNDDGISQNVSYLGEMTSKSNVTYKVVVSSMLLGDRGVTDLIFISKNKSYKYRLNTVKDAPFKIHYNRLYFRENGKEKSMSLDQPLRDVFCTPIECFNIN